MRSWILIDIDKIGQATYDLLAQDKEAFLRPSDGAFAIPVDTELSSYALTVLHARGVPMEAMRVVQ